MKRFQMGILGPMLLLLAVACIPEAAPERTPTQPPPTDTVVATTTIQEPCTMFPTATIPAYLRPHLESEVFAEVSSGMPLIIEAKTADGWLGFNPGIPQAANVGVFRHRWVQEASDIRLEGSCETLPVVVGPPPDVCFTMAMTDIPVFASPSTSAEQVADMVGGDFTAALSRLEVDWIELDLNIGTLDLPITGWMEATMVNFNGPCMGFSVPWPIEPLQAGESFSITRIHMIDTMIGWAIASSGEEVDHILRTSNGGSTWQDVTPPEPSPTVEGQGKDASADFLSGLNARVVYLREVPPGMTSRLKFWSTDDGGQTWSTTPTSHSIEFTEHPPALRSIDENNSWLLAEHFIGVGHHGYSLFRSQDGGLSYESIQSPPDTQSTCHRTEIIFGDSQTGLMTNECPFELAGGVFVDWSFDGGETWERNALSPPESQSDLFASSSICNTDSPTLLTPQSAIVTVECLQDGASRHFLYHSDDAGASWESFPYPGGDIYFLDAEFGWALDLQIHRTVNGGLTWTKVKTVSWDGQFSFVDEMNGWAVAQSEEEIALVHTTDGGRTWELLEPGIESNQ